MTTIDLTALLDQANWDVKQAHCQTVADVRVALIQAGHNFIYTQDYGVAVSRLGVVSVWARTPTTADPDHVSVLTNLEPAFST